MPEVVFWVYYNMNNFWSCLGSSFWKVGSRKVYAVSEADIERFRMPDLSDDEEHFVPPPSKRRKSNSDDLENMLQRILLQMSNVSTTLSGLKNLCIKYGVSIGLLSALDDSFECCICKTSPSQPPLIVCKECKTIIGCRRCVNEWYQGTNILDKSCPKCRTPRGYASTMELKGFGNLIETIMKAQTVESLNENDNMSTASTASLNYND